eukprot:7035435-Lingulodinium_polyedra.AAC.1
MALQLRLAMGTTWLALRRPTRGRGRRCPATGVCSPRSGLIPTHGARRRGKTLGTAANARLGKGNWLPRMRPQQQMGDSLLAP